MKSKIAKKLIFYIVVFSSAITLILTSFQLYNDFNYDVKSINSKLQQIEISYTQSVTNAVWLSDRAQLKSILDGITELPDIVYSEVMFNGGEKVSSGYADLGDDISEKIDLNYSYNNKNINIGSFTTVASLADVYSRLLDRLWVILLSNALKTTFVAIFIYLIFNRLVTTHLENISEFVKKDELEALNKPLVLRRGHVDADEFQTVVSAINDLRLRLHHRIEELDEKKQYLALTLNSIGDAVITTDAMGKVINMNPVAEQLTGWTEAEAHKKYLKTIFPIIDASTREPIDNPVDKVLASGETVYLSNHTTLIAKDGRESQIADSAAPIRDHKGNILGMVLVFNDVTEQYQLRQLAAKNKRDLQAILDNSPAVIYTKDIDGRYSFINRQFEDVFSLERGDIIGKTDHEIFSEDIADVFRRNDLDVIEAGETIESEEITPHQDGSHTYISNKFPLLDDDGNIYAVCGISTDITERIRQNEQLRHAQRMDALGKLTGGVAHDYNNMLAIILGYVDLLKQELKGQEVTTGYAYEIRHAAERGAKLTKKLLNFSRFKASHSQVVNINKTLHDEKDMLQKILTSRIQLSLDLDDNLWTSWLDDSELEDTLINICINAMHAIENTGKLTISTKNIEIEQGEYVQLSITDTGCGMDKQTMERIFDPFYTTKGERGTGLGLSQVYGFIERSHAIIKVNSEVDKGTEFILYFPRYQRDVNDEVVSKSMDIKDIRGDETILVVDDEPVLLRLASMVLTTQGYKVVTAESATDAISILEQQPVDLMITDIIMPDMNGYELAATVKEKYPGIKIQIASGYADNRSIGIVDKALQRTLLTKPYDIETLLTRVRQLLDQVDI